MRDPQGWREALWPVGNARRRLLEAVTRLISDRMDRLIAGQVAPTIDRETILKRLAAFDFNRPTDTGRTAATLGELMDLGLVQSAHARCFGLFNPTPALPGILADFMAAAWNPQLAVWSHAPAAVEAELHVLRHVAAGLGIDTEVGASHFTVGGSEANATALNVALTRLVAGFAASGVAGSPHPLLLYASAESHLAWLKVLHQAGLGRNALRLIRVDADGRLDTEALRQQLSADVLAGFAPVMIVATAGTTNAGAIDPLEEMADIASSAGAHFHVDASWGGAAAFSPRLAPLVMGLDRADSVTVDAHKWFSAPMGAGMFFCRRKAWLTEAFHVSTDYMPKGAAWNDFYTQSQQWSRRFIGLRLFMILAALGREGLANQIEYQTEMGRLLRRKLEHAGWCVINRTDLPVICFVDPAGTAPEKIVQAVIASGNVWISSTKTKGTSCIRACITSFLTAPSDLDVLLQELGKARESARRPS